MHHSPSETLNISQLLHLMKDHKRALTVSLAHLLSLLDDCRIPCPSSVKPQRLLQHPSTADGLTSYFTEKTEATRRDPKKLLLHLYNYLYLYLYLLPSSSFVHVADKIKFYFHGLQPISSCLCKDIISNFPFSHMFCLYWTFPTS